MTMATGPWTRCSAGQRHAAKMEDAAEHVFTPRPFFLLVLFSRFCYLVGDEMVSVPFLAVFLRTGLKVLRGRLNFSEAL
jgi:hypothetical protein